MTHRSTPDAGGKPVDRHRTPEIGIGLVYAADRAPSREEFLELVLAGMRRVGVSPHKRVRERDFSVWYGCFTSTFDESLVALLLPYPIDIRVYQCFADLTQLPGYFEQGNLDPHDAHARPLARYEHGTLIAYLGASAAPGNLHGNAVARSAVVEVRAVRPPRRSLPQPDYVGSRLHDLSTWGDTREAVLRWVFGLRTPGSYRRLRAIVDGSFGISVSEQRELATGGFGYIHTGWMDSGEEVSVSIVLRADLSTDLKYVALGHEFAHYVLHFPLLHLARRAEEVARGVPEVGPVLRQAMRRHLPRNQLELHADVFASNLLIPARINLRRWAEAVTDAHGLMSPEDHAWRLLVPLFRDTAGRSIGSSDREMREMAARDLTELQQRPAETLFERMLRAVVFRINENVTALTDTVSDGMQRVIDEMDQLAGEMFAANPARVREVVRAMVDAGEPDPIPWDPAVGEYDLIPPRDPDPSGLHRFIALEPAPDNPRGDDAGNWVDHHAPHRRAASLRRWRALAPEDVALRVYRLVP